ncbi:uncharacterized protein LOC105179211 isoform X2 [Sesamum indicum]|uniref:Uncharacterized protein LOC105179211 isoform X2 n=1 Tax=Sesamum indicum TaxID=4182 RepID=A0A6I9UNW7_SESIN|nr:uncharacterized protein LOC105179211 isoform X2 [Sesamum indicum]
MRRSFGGGGGGGMGGGTGGGGGIIRTVRRVVGGAPPEPFSPSANTTTTIASANSRKAKSFDRNRPTSPNTALTLSSSSSANGSGSSNNGTTAFSSLKNLPTSGADTPSWGGSPAPHDSEWECVDASEDGRASVFYEDLVFGTVPSRDEVQHAVSALQQVVGPSSTHFPGGKLAEDSERGVVDEITSPLGSEKRVPLSEFEKDWVEPPLHLRNSRMFQTYGSDRVYDAFHLLQTEPSIQRMVVSLSSDKAVWDAVLNNEMVKELRGSITQGESPGKGHDGTNPVKDILSWLLIRAKAKIMQLIDIITKVVNDAFHPPNGEKKDENTDGLEGKLKTSLFLSIVVLLIVVITRAHNA